MREQGGVAGDSGVAVNPDGGAKARRGAAQPTLQGDLLEAVVAPANMHAAWARVKSNKGAPGIDGMTIEDFPAFAKVHWPAIRQALIDGGYASCCPFVTCRLPPATPWDWSAQL